MGRTLELGWGWANRNEIWYITNASNVLTRRYLFRVFVVISVIIFTTFLPCLHLFLLH